MSSSHHLLHRPGEGLRLDNTQRSQADSATYSTPQQRDQLDQQHAYGSSGAGPCQRVPHRAHPNPERNMSGRPAVSYSLCARHCVPQSSPTQRSTPQRTPRLSYSPNQSFDVCRRHRSLHLHEAGTVASSVSHQALLPSHCREHQHRQIKVYCCEWVSNQCQPPVPTGHGRFSERYLGYTFSPQELSSQTHNIIRKITTTLSLLRNKHFTEVSKAAILKYYLFPKLNHLFFCEPLQPQIYNTLNQVMGWFLWGKSAEFDENIKTRFRMSTERLQQPLSAGGLGLWNMQMRHTAQLAWLFERCVRPPSLNNKTPTPLYAQAWMEKVVETSHARGHILSATFQRKVFFCSSILTRTFNSRKWIQNWASVSTPFIVPPHGVLRVKALYEASNTVPPPRLTLSQSKWEQQYGVDFTRIWNRIRSIHCAPQLCSQLWRIYAKCLPIMRGSQPAALCPFCQQHESTLHIFFECFSLQQVTNALPPILISWFGNARQWSLQSILPLQPNLRNPELHLHAIAVALRVI